MNHDALFSKFANAFNQSDDAQPTSLAEIQNVEKALGIFMPADLALFMTHYGNLWTPHILDIIVDNDIEMNDIQQFWSPQEIIDDKHSEFTSKVEIADLVAFASDCMGNLFCFKTDDIKRETNLATVYFYDHDFDTLHYEAASFADLIAKFNTLISKPFEK